MYFFEKAFSINLIFVPVSVTYINAKEWDLKCVGSDQIGNSLRRTFAVLCYDYLI